MKQKIFNILVNFRRGRITVDNAIDQLLRLIRFNHRLTASEMAEWFHDNYEEIAKTEGWQTQDKCKVEFKDLPESNRTTMIKVCDRWLNGY
jgi:hypothetical protein